MKRLYFLLAIVFFLTTTSSAQVVNFAKTLPVNSYSVGLAASYNAYKLGTESPMSYLLSVGWGMDYDLDMGVKYGYYGNEDYFGVEMQYLMRETRKNYTSIMGGIHKWKEWGVDGTISFTHSPQYWLNFSAGIDIDVDFTNSLEVKGWIPLNIGINAGESFFIFLEYDLPASNSAWDILSAGVNIIFR